MVQPNSKQYISNLFDRIMAAKADPAAREKIANELQENGFAIVKQLAEDPNLSVADLGLLTRIIGYRALPEFDFANFKASNPDLYKSIEQRMAQVASRQPYSDVIKAAINQVLPEGLASLLEKLNVERSNYSTDAEYAAAMKEANEYVGKKLEDVRQARAKVIPTAIQELEASKTILSDGWLSDPTNLKNLYLMLEHDNNSLLTEIMAYGSDNDRIALVKAVLKIEEVSPGYVSNVGFIAMQSSEMKVSLNNAVKNGDMSTAELSEICADIIRKGQLDQETVTGMIGEFKNDYPYLAEALQVVLNTPAASQSQPAMPAAGLSTSTPTLVDPASVSPLAIQGRGNQIMPYSEDFKGLQKALVNAGYDVGLYADGSPMCDGLEGPLSRKAIEEYAKINGLDLSSMTIASLTAHAQEYNELRANGFAAGAARIPPGTLTAGFTVSADPLAPTPLPTLPQPITQAPTLNQFGR